jgi:hypothetical protein
MASPFLKYFIPEATCLNAILPACAFLKASAFLFSGYLKINKSHLKSDNALEGYLSNDIYIPYPIQKSRKRIFTYPSFEWDMLKDIISFFLGIYKFLYPILYPV